MNFWIWWFKCVLGPTTILIMVHWIQKPPIESIAGGMVRDLFCAMLWLCALELYRYLTKRTKLNAWNLEDD